MYYRDIFPAGQPRIEDGNHPDRGQQCRQPGDSCAVRYRFVGTDAAYGAESSDLGFQHAHKRNLPCSRVRVVLPDEHLGRLALFRRDWGEGERCISSGVLSSGRISLYDFERALELRRLRVFLLLPFRGGLPSGRVSGRMDDPNLLEPVGRGVVHDEVHADTAVISADYHERRRGERSVAD